MFELPSPLEKIEHPLFHEHRVKLWIKRDDLIHPKISGNKWRKLKYNISEAIKLEKKEIITFGGAYSNHIAATAAACHEYGIQSVGIIRGEELSSNSNPTLQFASDMGMELKFASRDDFRDIRNNGGFHSNDAFVLPEGGENELAIMGVGELIQEIDIQFDQIITSIGTGTTLLGLMKSLSANFKAVGISSLKGDFIIHEIKEKCNKYNIEHPNFEIITKYSFGGYGKYTNELIDFINEKKREIGILFDPIYTGKAFFGVWKMIQEGIFDDQTLIFLHTGGLQGIDGFNQKSPRKIHI